MNKQLYTLLCYYLKISNIFFNKRKLKQLITSHPDSESLYAMADTLDELNIENMALKTDMNGLLANGFPAIVFTIKERRKFIVIEDIAENQVYYYDAETGNSVESLEEFAEKWTGIALYAAQDETQAELEQKKTAAKKRLLQGRNILSVMAGVACLIIWSVSVTWSPFLIGLLSLCSFGLVVSIFLTIQEFGESNRLLHKVCHLNRVTNCNAVLQSAASKLFGWLSMSDIGLCYFSGSIFSLMLAGIGQQLEAVISWLMLLALCSFPYTLFSLSYQIFKVKKVCPMCLCVVGVLWAEIAFAIFSWKSLTFIPISPVTVFSLLVGFALPVIIWAYIKPIWNENTRIRNHEYNYLRLRRMPAVIRALLSTEPPYVMDFKSDEIHLGTIDAPLHITIVMSLFCKPCEDSWNTLSRWLAIYPGLYQFTVRFTGYGAHDTKNTELIGALTEIYIQSGEDAFCKALNDWNKDRDYQKWKAEYYVDKSVTHQTVSVETARWQQVIFIPSAPTVFVDNRIFRYELSDLEYLLKELVGDE